MDSGDSLSSDSEKEETELELEEDEELLEEEAEVPLGALKIKKDLKRSKKSS